MGMAINLTGDEATLKAARPVVENFVSGLPKSETKVKGSGFVKDLSARIKGNSDDEGVIIPTQVNYVALGGRMYQPGERVPGSTSVITNFLRTGYLWDKIRVMGGAYGAGISLNSRMGTFAFSSYRDPNIKKTIENYKK